MAQYEAAAKFWILRIGLRLQEENTESISTDGVLQYPTTIRVTTIRQSIKENFDRYRSPDYWGCNKKEMLPMNEEEECVS